MKKIKAFKALGLILLALIMSVMVHAQIDRARIIDKPITTIDQTRNIALVEAPEMSLSVDKFTANSNEAVNLDVSSSVVVTDLCFEFPIDIDLIKINEIIIDGFLFFDTDLKNREIRDPGLGLICYHGLSLSSDTIQYKIDFAGSGTIKYNLYANDVLMDPYLIGSLNTSSQLAVRMPFDGNINATWATKPVSISSATLRYVSALNSYSYPAAMSNPSYLYDNNLATVANYSTTSIGDAVIDLSYNKTAIDTGAVWQVKKSVYVPVSESNLETLNITMPSSCFNASSTHFEVRIIMSTYSSAGYLWGYQSYYCSDGLSFVSLYSDAARAIASSSYIEFRNYESGMWITNQSGYSPTTQINLSTQYFNVLGLKWSNSFRFWGNDSYNALKNDANVSQTATASLMNFTSDEAIFNTSGYINTTYRFNETSNVTNRTYFIKAKINTFVGFLTLISSQNVTGGSYGGIDFVTDNTNGVMCRGFKNDGTAYSAVVTGLSTGVYYDFTCTINSTHIALYTNGVLSQRTARGTIADSAHYTLIGKHNTVGANLNGTVQDFKMYNRSLSAAEIAILHSNGNFTNNTKGESNASIYLNGNEFIGIANASFSSRNAYSVCTFFKSDLISSAPMIYDFGDGNTNVYAQIYAAGNLYVNAMYDTDNTMQNGNWYHLCYTDDATNTKLYLNGAVIESGSHLYSFNPAYYLRLGMYSGADKATFSNGLKGNLDEFMLYNYALSASEVRTLYHGYNASLQINIIDEVSKENISVPVVVELISPGKSGTFTSETSTVFINDLAYDFLMFRYSANGYTQRYYFMNLTTYSNTNVTLQLLNSSIASDITATVYDNTNHVVAGAYIYYLRYNIATNQDELAGIVKTDIAGQAIIPLVKNSEMYSFIIYYPWGVFNQQTERTPISLDNINFQIDLIPIAGEDVDAIYGISHTLSFDNTTDTFTLTYNDLNHVSKSVSLDVYQVNAGVKTLINSSSSTSQVGSIALGVAVANDTQYLAYATVNINASNTTLLDSNSYYQENPNPLGIAGLIVIVIVTIVFMFIAYWNLALAVAITPLPSVLGSWLSILPHKLLPILVVFQIFAVIIAVIIGRDS